MILLEVNDAWGIQSAVRLYNDDDEDVLECEKSLLESSGYTVLTVAFTASVWSLTTDNNTQPVVPARTFLRGLLGSYAALRAVVTFFRAVCAFFPAGDAVFPDLCAGLTTDDDSSLGCLAAR
jgi:hypothetical protein